MTRSGVHAALIALLLSSLVLLQLAEASPGRKLPGGERPAHEYAQSVSIASTQAAIQRLATNGASADNVKRATELSMKNAQHATKNWHMGYDDGLVGATGNKMAREDSDADRK